MGYEEFRDREIAASWVAVEPVAPAVVDKEEFVERTLSATGPGTEAFNVKESERRKAMLDRRVRAATAVSEATDVYRETVTPLEERTREIAVERRRLDRSYRVPVGPALIEQAEEELAAEAPAARAVVSEPFVSTSPPVVEGLNVKADSAVKRLLFLGIIASIAKSLSRD
jgi:hypothetical protein